MVEQWNVFWTPGLQFRSKNPWIVWHWLPNHGFDNSLRWLSFKNRHIFSCQPIKLMNTFHLNSRRGEEDLVQTISAFLDMSSCRWWHERLLFQGDECTAELTTTEAAIILSVARMKCWQELPKSSGNSSGGGSCLLACALDEHSSVKRKDRQCFWYCTCSKMSVQMLC